MVGLYNADIIPVSGVNGAASSVWSLKGYEYYKRLNSWPSSPTSPGVPTSLAASLGNSQITLSWLAPSDTGGISITDYIIEFKNNDTDNIWQIFNDGVSGSLSATITGLTNNNSYSFRIKSVNSIGESSYSSTLLATPGATPIEPLYIGNIGVSTLYSESSFTKINNLKLGLTLSEPYANIVVLSWAKLNLVLSDTIITSLLTILRSNGTSTFTGSGTAASPFFRAARVSNNDADGLMGKYTFTATANGTAYVTLTYYDDQLDNNAAYIKKNNILQGAAIDGGTATRSFSVATGDVITISSDNFLTSFENVSVYGV
jgi:hypothetical protein